MSPLSKTVLAFSLAFLVVLATATSVLANDVPSFKSDKDKDTKEWVGKVFEALIKGTRTTPQKIKVVKYEYSVPKDKKARKELHVTGTYEGKVVTKVLRKPFTAKVRFLIDTSNEKEWELLKIDYEDDNKVTGQPKAKHLAEMLKKFNK